MKKFLERLRRGITSKKAGVEVSGMKWFPIWEDAELISRIRFSAYKANPKSLRTETRVNLKLVEFKTEIEEEVIPQIPLISVGDLMNRFKTITPDDLSIPSVKEFKPKVAKIENPIAVMSDGLMNYEVQIKQIEEHGLQEVKSLKEKLAKARSGDEGAFKELYGDLYNILKDKPEIKRDVNFALGEQRIPTKKEFLGKDYCLLTSHFGEMQFNNELGTAGGGSVLPIFIPEDGFKMLPYDQMFMGRVLGVVYLYPKPLFKNLGPGFCLVAAAVSIAMQPGFLNK